MAKKKLTDWDRVFNEIRVKPRSPRVRCLPPVTDAELDEVEKQLKSRLPHSYREFMKRFGCGEFKQWIGLRPAQRIIELTTRYRKGFRQSLKHRREDADLSPYQWLSTLVYFAIDQGNHSYAWDPAAVTQSRPHECQFYFLPRLDEDRPTPAGTSFHEFLQWATTDIDAWQEPDEETGESRAGMRLTCGYVRTKKIPKKRDVKEWLAWKDNTVLKLAQPLREGKAKKHGFLILADALEEAGCQHADLLESCRGGDPDIDGLWVLEVLLGKPK